jgi:hypothetical protein
MQKERQVLRARHDGDALRGASAIGEWRIETGQRFGKLSWRLCGFRALSYRFPV